MNYLRLSLILCVICSSQLIGQSYQKLLGNRAEWFVKSVSIGGPTYDYYSAVRDTSFFGVKYYLLDGYHFNGNYMLREDTINQYVFFAQVPLNGEFIEEILLYNFNLNPGDSTYVQNPLSPAFSSKSFFVCDSVVQKQYTQGTLKTLYLSNTDTTSQYNNTIWIEGIGSLSLINSPAALGDTLGAADLMCSFQNGQNIYTVSYSDSCFSKVYLSDYENRITESSIYFSSETKTLYLDEEIRSIKIFNLNGQLISSERNLSSSVQLDGLKPGIYLVLTQNSEVQIVLLKILI